MPASGVAASWFDAFQIARVYDGLYDDEPPANWRTPRAVIAREYDALLFLATGTAARPLVH